MLEDADCHGAMSPESALRQSTVYSCVRVLSDAVAQLPCKLFVRDGEKTAPATGNPLYNILTIAPNPWQTAFDYWKWNVRCLCLRGFYLSTIVYSRNGKVFELLPVHPDCVTKIERRTDGVLRFSVTLTIQDATGRVYTNDFELRSDRDAFFAFYDTDDMVTPLSPIAVNSEAIRLAKYATGHGTSLFKNDATPPLVITVPQSLTEENAVALARSWVATGSGDRYGMPRVLEGGAKIEKMSMSNEDAQYLETRRYQKEEICGIFGVPPHLICDSGRAQGWSTVEQMTNEFITFALSPWLRRIEQAITRWLVPRKEWNATYPKFAVNAMLRGDTAARGTFYRNMWSVGALTPNEIRGLEEMNPIEGGDKAYVPLNAQGLTDEPKKEEKPL